jgi:hypothetical protein
MGIEVEAQTVSQVTDQLLGFGVRHLATIGTGVNEVPEVVVSAAQECSLRKSPDQILTWQLLALMLLHLESAGPNCSPIRSKLDRALAKRVGRPGLGRIIRQVWRVAKTIPQAAAMIRNEYARILVREWIGRVAKDSSDAD